MGPQRNKILKKKNKYAKPSGSYQGVFSLAFHHGKSEDYFSHLAQMILETSPWTHLLTN